MLIQVRATRATKLILRARRRFYGRGAVKREFSAGLLFTTYREGGRVQGSATNNLGLDFYRPGLKKKYVLHKDSTVYKLNIWTDKHFEFLAYD